MTKGAPFHAIALGSIFLAGAAFCAPAPSANVTISIQDHKFDPPEPHAPAHQPITLVVKNLDQTPSEFESKQLKVEKMVIGGGEITLQIRPMAPGRYRFFDDFNQNAAEGFLVVE
jgi:hypothetical protein